jgi:hypothetical protein
MQTEGRTVIRTIVCTYSVCAHGAYSAEYVGTLLGSIIESTPIGNFVETRYAFAFTIY